VTALEPDDVLTKGRLIRIGVAAAVVSRIFGRLVGIILVVVLARVSDPTTVALYGFLLGTVTLMASVTDLGVASLAGRDVAAKVTGAPEALRSSLGPQALSTAVAVVLTCLVAVLAGPGGVDASVLVPCSAFVVANSMFNLWAEVLRGDGRVVLEGVLQGVSALLLVGIGSLAVLAGAGIVPLLWIVAGKELAVLGLACIWLRPRSGDRAGLSFGALVKRSMWLAVAGTALVLLQQTPELHAALPRLRHPVEGRALHPQRIAPIGQHAAHQLGEVGVGQVAPGGAHESRLHLALGEGAPVERLIGGLGRRGGQEQGEREQEHGEGCQSARVNRDWKSGWGSTKTCRGSFHMGNAAVASPTRLVRTAICTFKPVMSELTRKVEHPMAVP